MMTRIKQWFQKLISWWRGWDDAVPADVPADAPIEHSSGGGVSVDPGMHIQRDGTLPRQGVAPQMGNQGEPMRSTIENWRTPDPLIHPYSPIPDENWETPDPFSTPAPQGEPERENTLPPAADENIFPARPIPPVPPTPLPVPAPLPPSSTKPKAESGPEPEVEQHLEFLRYLVERGIVNEGFPEDQTPDQYRK